MRKIHETRVKTTEANGEVTHVTSDIHYRAVSEEDYIKVYIRTMSVLHNVQGTSVSVLTEVLRRVGYDNKVVLAPSIRKEIAANVGILPNTLTRRLADLCEAKLLVKEATNVYLLNTYVFGRGKWADIVDNRKALPVSLMFKEGGVAFV